MIKNRIKDAVFQILQPDRATPCGIKEVRSIAIVF